MSDAATTRDGASPVSWYEEMLQLLGKMQFNSASDEDRGRIESLVRANPAARQLYVDYAAQCASLHWSGGRNVAGEVQRIAAPASGEAAETSAAPSPAALAAREGGMAAGRFFAAVWGSPAWRKRILAYSLVSGLLAVLVLVVTLSLAPAPHRDGRRVATQGNGADEQTGPAAAASPAGKLTRTRGAVWRSSAPRAGDVLAAGKWWELQSGLAEIEFDGGVRSVVEGPARFRLDSPLSGTLERGRMTSRVPKASSGFQIVTPLATVVDLGTEFGVAVLSPTRVELHVFTGRVRVEPREGRLAATEVAADQSLSLKTNRAGEVEFDSTARHERSFARTVPEGRAIGVNFCLGRDDTIPDYLSVGTVPSRNWNNVYAEGKKGDNSRIFHPKSDVLIDDLGAATDAVISWTATQGHRGGRVAAPASGWGRIFSTSLSGDDRHGEVQIEFDRVPFAAYDVYVFAGNEGAETLSLEVAGREFFYAQSDFSSPRPAIAVESPGTIGANYVVVRGLTEPSFSIRTKGSISGVVANRVYGVQIVERKEADVGDDAAVDDSSSAPPAQGEEQCGSSFPGSAWERDNRIRVFFGRSFPILFSGAISCL